MLVGVGTLLLSWWLSDWYRLPHSLMLIFAAANFGYGTYSLNLARLRPRPTKMLLFLIIANGAWGVFCFVLAVRYFGTASFLGIGHFVAEGLFVGGLAVWEWRWRNFLK